MRWVGSLFLLLAASAAHAGEADVIGAEALQVGSNTWRVQATIQHADEGWDHYADRFDVLDAQGNVLAERVLLHPHVEEQPFTRSVGVTIPEDVDVIIIRAHDSVDGLGGQEFELRLQR